MFRATCLVVFTSLTIAADTGQLNTQLLSNAQHAEEPASLLWIASEQGSQQAQQQLHNFAEQKQDGYWLEKLIGLGFAPAALTLSRIEDNPRISQRLVRLAARGGVAQAQYEFALSRDDYSHRASWLTAAAEQGLFEAQTALADWYLLYQQPELAEPWLAQTAGTDPQSAFQLAYLRWQHGEQEEAKALFEFAAEHEHEEAAEVLSVLNRYQPVSVSALRNQLASSLPDNWLTAQCRQRMQPLATGLAEMVQADRIFRQFKRDRRLQSLSLCVATPQWLADNTMRCDANWRGQGRLGCDIRPLAETVEANNITHLMVLAQSGKANVNNGVMYLDVGDTYSVFVHELAHFVGFVDEYPLTAGLAREYCSRKTAPNLVFLGEITYAPLDNIAQWQAIEFPVRLYPARTCHNIRQPSYKPSERMTFLENHDAKYIPPLYLSIWQQRLNDPGVQRTVSMNLFQAFQRAKQTEQAAFWLDRVRQEKAAFLPLPAEQVLDESLIDPDLTP